MRIDLHRICRIAVLDFAYPVKWSKRSGSEDSEIPEGISDGDLEFDWSDLEEVDSGLFEEEVAKFKTEEGADYSIVFASGVGEDNKPFTYVYFEFHDPKLGGQGRLDMTGTGNPGKVLGTVVSTLRYYQQQHEDEVGAHRFKFSAMVEGRSKGWGEKSTRPTRGRVYEAIIRRFVPGWKVSIEKGSLKWTFDIQTPKYQGMLQKTTHSRV